MEKENIIIIIIGVTLTIGLVLNNFFYKKNDPVTHKNKNIEIENHKEKINENIKKPDEIDPEELEKIKKERAQKIREIMDDYDNWRRQGRQRRNSFFEFCENIFPRSMTF